MLRRTALVSVAIAALAAGCTRGPADRDGVAAPVAVGNPTATAAGGVPTAPAGRTPAATTKSATAPSGSRPAPTLPPPQRWTWSTDQVTLPDGSVATVAVPVDWPATVRTGDPYRIDRRSPDGSLLLRIEKRRTTEPPTTAVRTAATRPYEGWSAYRRSASIEPHTDTAGITSGGGEFSFRDGGAGRYGRVATFAGPGWVLSVHTSGPDRTGVPTGLWDLAQKAGAVRFARAAG